MPDERSKVRTENEAWPVLQQVIERLGLTRKGFLDRLADYGQARTESDYRNWSKMTRPLPHDRELLLAMVRTVVEHQSPSRRCTASEALRFLALAGMPFGELPSIAELFPADQFHDALAQYLPAITVAPRREDWGDAPDETTVYGRQTELDMLRDWITSARCRLVGIFGMGGIGKTKLAGVLARQLCHQFDVVIWRSLVNAPPIEEILDTWLLILAPAYQRDSTRSIDQKIALVLQHCQDRRCLLVLDNFETILNTSDRERGYRAEHVAYGQLLHAVGEGKHQSCVLVTGREKPEEIVLLEGATEPTRSHQLSGLSSAEGRGILKGKGLQGTNQEWDELFIRYSGNPLALKLVAEPIRELYDGEIGSFLRDSATIFGSIRLLLDKQFARLSDLEQEIMYWLAIAREPVSLADLETYLMRSTLRRTRQEALGMLRRRSLIEKTPTGWTLQYVIMEYVTDLMVSTIRDEIENAAPELLHKHALIIAQTKDYVRESQVRLILTPIVEPLHTRLGLQTFCQQLDRLLEHARNATTPSSSYLAGNVINLLVYLKRDLRGRDFSNLTIRQAYLQGVPLQDANFACANLASSVFTDTFGSVLALVFTPDGSRFAASTTTGEIRIWSVRDGAQLLRFVGHTDWVQTIAMHPDGTMLASGSDDQTVKLWDLQTGQCLATLIGHANAVTSVVFSPDGCLLASTSYDQTIRMWDLENSQCITVLQGHRDSVNSLAFSLDGTTLVSGSSDNSVRVWSVANGQCTAILIGHTGTVWCVDVHPDGALIASGSEDGTVRLWDSTSGACRIILRGHTEDVECMAFSPDGKILVSSGDDQQLWIWDVATGASIATLQGHTSTIWSVAFSSDSLLLASGADDQTIRLWDVGMWRCLRTLQGYTNAPRAVTFSPDCALLASAGEDRIVRLWDIHTGTCRSILEGHTLPLWSVAFNPDGETLASGGDDGIVYVWDAQTGQCRTKLDDQNWLVDLCFSPVTPNLIACSGDYTVRLWDIRTGRHVHTLTGHTGWVRGAAFSLDGQTLASVSDDRTVRLWNIQHGEQRAVLGEHLSMALCVGFSTNGQTIAVGCDDGSIWLWDVDALHSHTVLAGHTSSVWSIAFDPNDQTLVSGSSDQTVRLWDIETGQCRAVLQEHTRLVWSVAFSSDGHTIASASDDETIKLWNATTGICEQTLRSDRPCERMRIAGVIGLTEAQKAALIALGAVNT